MNLIATLDMAIEIEQALAECYQKMTEVFAGDPLCTELEKLGKEEISHKQLIKTGKSYALKAPEAFPKESDFYEEMKRGLALTRLLMDDLDKTAVSKHDALERMYALEKRMETVHMNSIVEIKDPSLARLFEALAEGDKLHRNRLERLMAGR